jgi:hypothetical protein
MIETDWITRITLIYWSIEPLSDTDSDATVASDSHPPDPFDEGRRKVFFPPKTFGAKKLFFRGKKRNQDADASQKSYTVQENATSLVISTNPFGEFGKCTVISKIVPELTYLNVARQVFTLRAVFAYLPSVARCLIFLAFLGTLCDGMSTQYDQILSAMTETVAISEVIIITRPFSLIFNNLGLWYSLVF